MLFIISLYCYSTMWSYICQSASKILQTRKPIWLHEGIQATRNDAFANFGADQNAGNVINLLVRWFAKGWLISLCIFCGESLKVFVTILLAWFTRSFYLFFLCKKLFIKFPYLKGKVSLYIIKFDGGIGCFKTKN